MRDFGQFHRYTPNHIHMECGTHRVSEINTLLFIVSTITTLYPQKGTCEFKLAVLLISTDEDPSLRIESSAIINLRGVSTKLNKYIAFTMQTYKKLNHILVHKF